MSPFAIDSLGGGSYGRPIGLQCRKIRIRCKREAVLRFSLGSRMHYVALAQLLVLNFYGERFARHRKKDIWPSFSHVTITLAE